jgi:cyanophycinase-like exopeptidase
MGRMMAFLCRQLGSGRTQNAWGLGINEGAAIVIDRDGIGTVYGETAYIVQADRPNTACRSEDQPVNYAGYKIWRLDPGSRYDFAQRPQSGFYRVDVEQGQLSGNPYVRPEVEGALAKAQPRSDLSGY